MMNKIKKHHLVIFSALIALTVICIIYFQNDQSKDHAFIRPYEKEKDYVALVRLMKANLFWISTTPKFSPEKMLNNRAPSEAPEKKGSVNVDVIEDEEQTAGFIAYYKKGRDHGFIWLLAVDKEFRGQGFGDRLLERAINNLKQEGSKYVTIGTRLINKPALSLYQKHGFVEKYRNEDRGIIVLIKREL